MAKRVISPGLGIGFAPARQPKRVVNTVSQAAAAAAKAADHASNPSGSVSATWLNDPAYIGAQGDYGASVSAADSDLAYGKTTAANQFGYLADGTVNPNDPFSRAELLQKHYDQSQAQSTNSMAAGGQLYAGSLQNAQNANLTDFQAGDSRLRGEYQDTIAQLIQRRRDAIRNASSALTGAGADALNRTIGG